MPLPVFIPLEKHFDSDTREEILRHVDKNCTGLLTQWQELRTSKISSWRKVYRATPREKYKSFPWKNAANLVPGVVASFADQLTARLVMGLYGTDPLFPAGLVGTFGEDEQAEEQRNAVETFLSQMGKSPSELNLFYNQCAWLSNGVKYGFSVLKSPWETVVEQIALDGSSGVVFEDFIKSDGPKPTPLLFEKFLCPLNVAEFEQAPFLAQIVTLNELDLRNRVAQKIYRKEDVEALLKSPDRFGPDQAQRETQNDIAGGSTSSEIDKEWDLYECYFPYIHNGKRFHIIYTYHKLSKTMMRSGFNFFPQNSLPFRMFRLGTDGESILGMGFCSMLGMYQEEIAQIHNQRRDSGTLANTTIIRASRSSQLDTNFSIYPMAVLPGEDGEYEFMPVGRAMTETIKEEQMTLQLATDRAGVGPASSGSGAGTVNKKGSYSAMGSFATSQEGNTRANLHQTTSRFAHLSLGNDLLRLYAHFGVTESKLKSMGKMGEHLKMALENVKKGRLWIPIYAATGSINKEIEKQNLMLLLQQFRAHYQTTAQMMAAVDSPMTPSDVKAYTMKVIGAGNVLMTRIAKDFGIEDPSRILPEAQMQPGPGQAPPGQPQPPIQAGSMNPDAIKQLAAMNAGPTQ
jgi:hypothetical protein